MARVSLKGVAPAVVRERGFTLVELLMTVLLMALMIPGIWTVFRAGLISFSSENDRLAVKGESGRGFVEMTEELRHATSMTAALAASLSFTVDMDDNGSDETVQYTWSGTAGDPLNRVSSFTVPAIPSVSSVSLSYYDSSGNLLSFPVTASQVRIVAVNLTVGYRDETFNLRTQVRLRNL